MKVSEILVETNLSRRGFLQGLIATASSNGVNLSGLAKAANAIVPSMFPIVDKIAEWVGTDPHKYRLLDSLLINNGLGLLTRKEFDQIEKRFRVYYRGKNPTATNKDIKPEFDEYMDNLRKTVFTKDNTDEYLAVLRDLKGAPLEIDSVIDIAKAHGEDIQSVLKFTLYDKDASNIFSKVSKTIKDINRAASASRRVQRLAKAAEVNKKTIQQQLKSIEHKARAQVERVKNTLNRLDSLDPEKAKFAIKNQLDAISRRVNETPDFPEQAKIEIEQRVGWINAQIDNIEETVKNPELVEKIKSEMEILDRILRGFDEQKSKDSQPEKPAQDT